MNEDYNMVERQRQLLARERAQKKRDKSAPATPLSKLEILRVDLSEERDRRSMYSNPLIVGGLITQFFATVAVNDLARYGCFFAGLIVMLIGIRIFATHTKRISKLKREIANADS